MKWWKYLLLCGATFLSTSCTQTYRLICDDFPEGSTPQMRNATHLAPLSYEARIQLAQSENSTPEMQKYAYFNLGVLTLTGTLTPQDSDAALAWFVQAAQKGHVDAMSLLCREGQSHWYASLLQAAQAGDPRAQELIASSVGSNNCVVDMDYQKRAQLEQYWLEQAFKGYQQAALQGDEQALLRLGDMYLSGTGVARNRPQALKNWGILANKGSPLAQMLVAHQSQKDATGEQEAQYQQQYEDALARLRLLAARGQASSDELVLLGMLYADGYKSIIERDKQKAYILFSLSMLRTVQFSNFPDLEFEKTAMVMRFFVDDMSPEKHLAADELLLQCMKDLTEQCY